MVFRCQRDKIGVAEYIREVQREEIREIAERQPFRPFGVRLSNGARYFFNQPRDFGAPEDLRMIVYFGNNEFVLIDTENIVQVFP
ncbi:MAG: hypothetical protein ABR589_02685 [Chthoniobacterales bacterium]